MLQLNLKGLCATHVTLYNIVQFVNIMNQQYVYSIY